MADDNALLKELLQRFDDTMEPLDDHGVYGQISKLNQSESEHNTHQTKQLSAECTAFMFCPEYNWEDRGWKSYYGPMMEWRTKDGAIAYTPDIAQLDEEIFSYWEKRAREAMHPFLKARYADICWDFQKSVISKAPNIAMARIVVDSTIEAVVRRLIKSPVDGHKKLARALSVALSVHDSGRVAELRDAIVSYEEVEARDQLHGTWGFAFELIVENRTIPKSEKLEKKIVDNLESRLMRLSANVDGKPTDVWGVEAAALRLAKYYRRLSRDDDVRRVLLIYSTAFEQSAMSASSVVASGWLLMVHRRYLDFNLREEAEKLLLLVKRYSQKSMTEMTSFSEKIEIPREEINQYLDAMVQGDLITTLNRIAFHFVPKKDQIVNLLKDIQTKAPLTSILPLTIVDRDGRPTASIGSINDDLEGRVVNHLGQHLQFGELFLRLTLDRMNSVYMPSPEIIHNHLRKSPAFFEDQMPSLIAGLKFYLNEDHLSAAHLLVPQIEASIRHLLDLSNVNVWKSKRNMGLLLKNLDELLREPSTRKCFGEDIELYLRTLLTDQRGWNVRNNLCHGMMVPALIGRGITDRLFHVLLILGEVRHSLEDNGGKSPT